MWYVTTFLAMFLVSVVAYPDEGDWENVATNPTLNTVPTRKNQEITPDHWFCTDDQSRREGNSIYVCGVGESRWEGAARAKAFSYALRELALQCKVSDDCHGHKKRLVPMRTTCVKNADYKCYRLVVLEIGDRK